MTRPAPTPAPGAERSGTGVAPPPGEPNASTTDNAAPADERKPDE